MNRGQYLIEGKLGTHLSGRASVMSEVTYVTSYWSVVYSGDAELNVGIKMDLLEQKIDVDSVNVTINNFNIAADEEGGLSTWIMDWFLERHSQDIVAESKEVAEEFIRELFKEYFGSFTMDPNKPPKCAILR